LIQNLKTLGLAPLALVGGDTEKIKIQTTFSRMRSFRGPTLTKLVYRPINGASVDFGQTFGGCGVRSN
jgi:hypothetical protein